MIVYVITKLELGGAQKVCLELVRGVDDHMPTALISGQHGALVPAAKSLPRAFLLPTLQREVRLLGFVHDARTFFAIWRLLRRLKKEHKHIVVHTHSTKAGIIGRWAAWSAGIKQRVHTIHGYSFHDYLPWYTWLAHYQIEWLTSLITTHFVCVSEKDRQTGIRLFPRFAQKSSIIRAAVDAKKLGDQSFIPAYRADKPLVIGTIACFKPQKNLLDLLQAFQYVHTALLGQGHPAPKLEIIGDGQQRAIIETWLQQHHLTEAVRLLGWQNDVQPFLQQWDIFALTSLWEGLPCSVVEARLSKLPVVAYDVGGIREIIKHGQNGFLIQPGEWQDVADKILTLTKDPALYRSLAHFSDDLTDFDNNTMVKKHATLYNSLLSIKPE